MGREVKRVALDFDWPLNKVWAGYLRPDELAELPCPACEGGYSPYAQNLDDRWYGNVPFDPAETGSVRLTPDTPAVRAFAERNVSHAPAFYGTSEDAIRREAQRLANMWNKQWSHHLAQEDVDALIAGHRLYDFTHHFVAGRGWIANDPPTHPTATQVNTWSLSGLGHDSINCYVVIKARCAQAGESMECTVCDGHGSIEAYPGQRAAAEAWQKTEPPAGEGWQLWETVTEGSPVSPVFPTRAEFVRWLIEQGYSREAAENFTASGWAPSFVACNGVMQDGIAACAPEPEDA